MTDATEQARKEQAQAEYRRVTGMIEDALGQMERDGGNLAWFSVFLLRAGMEIHRETFGAEALDAAVSKMGADILARTVPGAGRA